MSFKMKLDKEVLSVFKIFSTMCNRCNIYQNEGLSKLLYFDEQEPTIVYRASINDRLFEDKELMDFQLEGLKEITTDINYLGKEELPAFVVDSAIKTMTVNHRVGSKTWWFSKLMENKAQYDEKRFSFMREFKPEEFAFQLSINEKDLTLLKQRVMGVKGVTSDGYVRFSCDTNEVYDMEVIEDKETVTKKCHRVLVEAITTIKSSKVEHELWCPIEEGVDYSSFELRINAKDLNKIKVSSKSTIDLGFAYSPRDKSIVNKVVFKSTFSKSDICIIVMAKKEE